MKKVCIIILALLFTISTAFSVNILINQDEYTYYLVGELQNADESLKGYTENKSKSDYLEIIISLEKSSMLIEQISYRNI